MIFTFHHKHLGIFWFYISGHQWPCIFYASVAHLVYIFNVFKEMNRSEQRKSWTRSAFIWFQIWLQRTFSTVQTESSLQLKQLKDMLHDRHVQQTSLWRLNISCCSVNRLKADVFELRKSFHWVSWKTWFTEWRPRRDYIRVKAWWTQAWKPSGCRLSPLK